MFNNDRHLNIFEHYTQPNALPIENNLTRGLAIVLSENPFVMDRFIDLINNSCIKNISSFIPKPQRQEEVSVGIQLQITDIVKSFPNPQQIAGITLTTSKPISSGQNNNNPNNMLITDIVIGIRDTLVVIEVKRNAANAQAQLKQQIKSITAQMQSVGSTPPQINGYYDTTWEELVGILQDCNEIQNRDKNDILSHYLKHLGNRYPEWFPVTPFSNIECIPENEIALKKRLEKLMEECCKGNADSRRYLGRQMIPLDYDFASEAHLDIDYIKKTIVMKVWPGDTKGQGYCLFNNTQNGLSWINNKKVSAQGHSFEMKVKPYLRMAHFQSTVFIEYFNRDYYDNNFGADKNKCIALFNEITKEWKKADWNSLENTLCNKYNAMIDNNSFKREFQNRFINSNRNYVHVSFGYEISIFIPYEIGCEYDKNGQAIAKNGALADLVMEACDDLLDKIK